MAEIGIIASVIQVAGAGLTLSKTLYEYADGVASADQRIKDIANEVQLTSFVIDELAHVFRQDETAKVLRAPAILTADRTVKECSAVFEKLDAAVKKSKKGFVGRLGFPFKESKIQLLRANIDRLKSTLQLLMHVLTHAHQVASSKEQKEQVRELIRVKDESTKRYEESLKNFSFKSGSDDATVVSDDDTSDEEGIKTENEGMTSMGISSIASTLDASSLATCVHHIKSLLNNIEHLQGVLSDESDGKDASTHHQSVVGSYLRARKVLDQVLGGSKPSPSVEPERIEVKAERVFTGATLHENTPQPGRRKGGFGPVAKATRLGRSRDRVAVRVQGEVDTEKRKNERSDLGTKLPQAKGIDKLQERQPRGEKDAEEGRIRIKKGHTKIAGDKVPARRRGFHLLRDGNAKGEPVAKRRGEEEHEHDLEFKNIDTRPDQPSEWDKFALNENLYFGKTKSAKTANEEQLAGEKDENSGVRRDFEPRPNDRADTEPAFGEGEKKVKERDGHQDIDMAKELRRLQATVHTGNASTERRTLKLEEVSLDEEDPDESLGLGMHQKPEMLRTGSDSGPGSGMIRLTLKGCSSTCDFDHEHRRPRHVDVYEKQLQGPFEDQKRMSSKRFRRRADDEHIRPNDADVKGKDSRRQKTNQKPSTNKEKGVDAEVEEKAQPKDESPPDAPADSLERSSYQPRGASVPLTSLVSSRRGKTDSHANPRRGVRFPVRPQPRSDAAVKPVDDTSLPPEPPHDPDVPSLVQGTYVPTGAAGAATRAGGQAPQLHPMVLGEQLRPHESRDTEYVYACGGAISEPSQAPTEPYEGSSSTSVLPQSDVILWSESRDPSAADNRPTDTRPLTHDAPSSHPPRSRLSSFSIDGVHISFASPISGLGEFDSFDFDTYLASPLPPAPQPNLSNTFDDFYGASPCVYPQPWWTTEEGEQSTSHTPPLERSVSGEPGEMSLPFIGYTYKRFDADPASQHNPTHIPTPHSHPEPSNTHTQINHQANEVNEINNVKKRGNKKKNIRDIAREQGIDLDLENSSRGSESDCIDYSDEDVGFEAGEASGRESGDEVDKLLREWTNVLG